MMVQRRVQQDGFKEKIFISRYRDKRKMCESYVQNDRKKEEGAEP